MQHFLSAPRESRTPPARLQPVRSSIRPQPPVHLLMQVLRAHYSPSTSIVRAEMSVAMAAERRFVRNGDLNDSMELMIGQLGEIGWILRCPPSHHGRKIILWLEHEAEEWVHRVTIQE